jgi:hypothetical protein
LIKNINIINGIFRTPKIKYLNKSLDHINIIHNTSLEKLTLNRSNLYYNALSAGFTEVDGDFKISLQGKHKIDNCITSVRIRVKCTFSISQKVVDKPTDDTCVPFMSKIAEFFQS